MDYRPDDLMKHIDMHKAMDEYKYMSMGFHDTKSCLNKIVTDFKKWELWHGTAEICNVGIDYRGPARFHQRMQERALMDFKKNSKKFADKPFGIVTEPNMEEVTKAMQSAHFKEEHFMSHLDIWLKMLEESHMLFTESAYYLSAQKKITFYRMTCCYLEQLENELWAVNHLKNRITPTNISHPDAYSVFERVHVYFDPENKNTDTKHYDGGMIDFDI